MCAQVDKRDPFSSSSIHLHICIDASTKSFPFDFVEWFASRTVSASICRWWKFFTTFSLCSLNNECNKVFDYMTVLERSEKVTIFYANQDS